MVTVYAFNFDDNPIDDTQVNDSGESYERVHGYYGRCL